MRVLKGELPVEGLQLSITLPQTSYGQLDLDDDANADLEEDDMATE